MAEQGATEAAPESGIHLSLLSFLIVPLFWSLSSCRCSVYPMTASLPSLLPAAAVFAVLLHSGSWLVTTPRCFHCLASASLKTSLERICNSLGLTLFSAECFSGVLRPTQLRVAYWDPRLWSHSLVAKMMGLHNTKSETCGWENTAGCLEAGESGWRRSL